MKAKLALGTVQFGLPYGVSNQSGQTPQPEVEAILRRAEEAGIDMLDTAVAYGDSEGCLGRVGVSSWRVITKLPPLPAGAFAVREWAESQITGSLRRLRLESIEGLLVHWPADLLGTHGAEYARVLSDIKAAGIARAVGVSVYDPAELDSVWAAWRPDLIQAPYNVLDRRLAHSGWLDRLVDSGVRVHIRSVFLQGLLLMPAAKRPAWFVSWQGTLDRWAAWCRELGVSPLQGALAFARDQPGVERVVVGVNSLSHLDEILDVCSIDVPLPPADLFSEELDLIKPTRWRLA